MEPNTIFLIALAFFKGGTTKWVNLEDVQARYRFIKREGKAAA